MSTPEQRRAVPFCLELDLLYYLDIFPPPTPITTYDHMLFRWGWFFLPPTLFSIFYYINYTMLHMVTSLYVFYMSKLHSMVTSLHVLYRSICIA